MFFVEALDHQTIHAMMRGKRLREGTEIELPEGVKAIIEAHLGDGVFRLQLTNHGDLWAWLERAGQVPLPPYIQRTPHSVDEERYQTVFARNRGAVAAPTAGLHFTDEILGAMQERCDHREGYTAMSWNFMPMRVDHIKDHKMHSRPLRSHKRHVRFWRLVVRLWPSAQRWSGRLKAMRFNPTEVAQSSLSTRASNSNSSMAF